MSSDRDPAFEAFPEIETQRLILREILPADAGAIHKIFADPAVTRYYDLESFEGVEHANALIDFFDESFELERAIRWGVTLKDDDVVIGTCGYVWLRKFRGEIGYELARPYWRQGIMSEALDAILEFGFSELSLNRIEALVMSDNVASAALLRSLGFEEEGVLRQHDFFKGQFHDMRMLSILSSDFFA